jgi:hypothetical protein
VQFDPAGYKNEVNGIRNIPTVDEAVARFTTAYNTALRAEQLDQGGRVREATDEWQKSFGDYFPSYG